MTANHEHTPTPTALRRSLEPMASTYFVSAIAREQFLAEYDRMIAQVEAAAEQRGAARGKIEGLREAATIIRDSKFANSVKPPSKKVQVKEADWLDALADRLEGENGDV